MHKFDKLSVLSNYQFIDHVEKISLARKCSFIDAATDIFSAKVSGTFKRLFSIPCLLTVLKHHNLPIVLFFYLSFCSRIDIWLLAA
jgi:hypothetical protein